MPPPRRPDPPPLETDDVRVALVGTAVWLVALLLTLVFHGWLADHGNGDWVWIALCGFGLGLVAIRYFLRRRAALRREAASRSGPGPDA
jgi:hypothetical protein